MAKVALRSASMRRALDAVARWTIRSPRSAIAWAVLPALGLAALLPTTTVDLTFTGVMNRGNEHVGRYFEMSAQYDLGGLLLVLLEGEEERLDEAVERTIHAASALPSVAAARGPLPLDWLEEQAPWLVERPLFDRWLAVAERPEDLANLAEFAASAVALRGRAAGSGRRPAGRGEDGEWIRWRKRWGRARSSRSKPLSKGRSPVPG